MSESSANGPGLLTSQLAQTTTAKSPATMLNAGLLLLTLMRFLPIVIMIRPPQRGRCASGPWLPPNVTRRAARNVVDGGIRSLVAKPVDAASELIPALPNVSMPYVPNRLSRDQV